MKNSTSPRPSIAVISPKFIVLTSAEIAILDKSREDAKEHDKRLVVYYKDDSLVLKKKAWEQWQVWLDQFQNHHSVEASEKLRSYSHAWQLYFMEEFNRHASEHRDWKTKAIREAFDAILPSAKKWLEITKERLATYKKALRDLRQKEVELAAQIGFSISVQTEADTVERALSDFMEACESLCHPPKLDPKEHAQFVSVASMLDGWLAECAE